MNNCELQEFAGGALQEKFSIAFQEIIENMQNPNTSFKNKRSITIKLDFTQNELRDDAKCSISVVTKTAPVQPISTAFAIGKDLKTGQVFAEEYGKQVRGQMSIGDIDEEPEEETNNSEDSESNNVVDLRTAKKA